MQILDILEPIKPDVPSDEIAIGIDLGTTNSLGAIFRNEEAQILGNIVPSRICSNNGRLSIDYQSNPSSISSIKSYMGKIPADLTQQKLSRHNISLEDDQIKFNIAGKKYSAEELSAFILMNIKHQSEMLLEKEINKAVITVPAYFDDHARQATLRAAEFAGLEVLRLINEPTAAALAYGLNNHKEGLYGVYDFGGGTFDCTILQMKMGVFKVISTAGDNNLGGDDIDKILINNFYQQNTLNLIESAEVFLSLKDQLQKIKEDLSKNESIKRNIKLAQKEYLFSITQHDFNQLITPILQRTFKLFHLALNEAQVNINELEGIIMVGGSSRIGAIKDYFKQLVADEKILDKQDPEKLVAYGAAIAAYNLTNYCGKLLVDVIPLSLSIEIMGGLCERIINKNTPIPTTETKLFTTYEDGQTGMIFHVVQGEREFARDCRSLARFELKNIPPMKAGKAKIELSFKLDADGLLSVTALESTTGHSVQIELNPTYGIKSDEINSMLEDSYKNAEADISSKSKLETILKAKSLMKSLKDAIRQYPAILIDKQAEITNLINQLNQSITVEDIGQVEKALDKLAQLSEEFASKQISEYFTYQVKGKTIDYINEHFLKEENDKN